MKKSILFLVLFLLLLFVISLNVRPEPKALTQYLVTPINTPASEELSVQFLGNTNLLFSDGTTHILTDGFFSRPSAMELLGEEISPNREVIMEDMKRANITKLDALIPVHSAEQMQIPPLNEPISIGKFTLTFIASRHWQYPDKAQRERLLDQSIDAPITTPASIYDYKEGISYTILIEHGATKFAVQGSAGWMTLIIRTIKPML